MEKLKTELSQQQVEINPKAANQLLGSLASGVILQWALDTFDDSLFALSSFGAESALLFKQLHDADVNVPVITIDTGFWFKETHDHKDALQSHFGLKVHTYGPSKQEIQDIKRTKLWRNNLTEYHEITKINPLKRAIGELGVGALLSGIRRDQTTNRFSKQTVEVGNQDEYRIHPALEWEAADVKEYIKELPAHPLVSQGYASIGDKTTTTKGEGRAGRRLGPSNECGIQNRHH